MNNAVLANKCMDILCSNVGIVDAERFIQYIKSEAFDYTKWQREYYDEIPPEVLREKVRKYNSEFPFQGTNVVRI